MKKLRKVIWSQKTHLFLKTLFRLICDGIYVDTLFIRVAT